MKLITDSCVDFNENLLPSGTIERIPFKITIDGVEYSDIGNNVREELDRRDFQSEIIRTACPSPGEFYLAMKDSAESFVVTISSKLSGAYQSAINAMDMIKEEIEELSTIHVFDSKSASAGETLVSLKIQELIDSNQMFSQIVDKTEEYIQGLRTFFVLETLDTLVSNGRVSKMNQIASKALKLFPIMGEDGQGSIEKKDIARGEKNVVPKLLAAIGADTPANRTKKLAITHIDALDRAKEIKQRLEKSHSFQDILIFKGSGLSSVYASKGGIVLAY